MADPVDLSDLYDAPKGDASKAVDLSDLYAAPPPPNSRRLPSGEYQRKGFGDPVTGTVDDFLHRQSQYGREAGADIARGVKHVSDLPAYAKTHDPLRTANRAAQDVAQVGQGALSWLSAVPSAAFDSTVGVTGDQLTGGIVPTRVGGTIASLLTPVGEARVASGVSDVVKAARGGEFNPMALLKQLQSGAATRDKAEKALAAAETVKRATRPAGPAKPNSIFDPAARAAARLLNKNPKEQALEEARRQREAGYDPTMVSTANRKTLRTARAAGTRSDEAEQIGATYEGGKREQITTQTVDRIKKDAPYGTASIADVKKAVTSTQDALASAQFRPAYAQPIDVPDKVMDVVTTPETRSELRSVINTEVERAAHPEKYPDAPQNVTQLRELATYADRKAEWDAAKANYDEEKAAYDAKSAELGANSAKATKDYERKVKLAQTRYEKAKDKWEADKQAWETGTKFRPEDFSTPPGQLLLDTLNSKVHLLQGDPISAARVKANQDKMLEGTGYRGRPPFPEPEPVLDQVPKPPSVDMLKVPEDPGPPPARPVVSSGALDRVRIGLRDKGRSLYDTNRSLGGALGEHANAIDAALDDVEALKPARATYKQLETRKRILDMDPKVVFSSPQDMASAIREITRNQPLDEQQKADLTHVIMSHIADLAAGDPGKALTTAKKFGGGAYFKTNMTTLLGKANAEKLATAMGAVRKEMQGLNYISGGSKTADKQEDLLRGAVDVAHIGHSVARFDPIGAIAGGSRLLTRHFGVMSPEEAQEVMKFLATDKPPEEVYKAMEALVKSNVVPPDAPPNIRAILNKAIAASAAQRLAQPQRLRVPGQ